MEKKWLFSLLLILICNSCSSQQPKDADKTVAFINGESDKIRLQSETYDKVEKDILGESTEGGVVMGFFQQANLRRISALIFGETGKVQFDYYIRNSGTPMFMRKQTFFYNKPIYIEGSQISKVQEELYYYDNDNLIRWVKPDKSIADVASVDFKQEQKFFLEDFNHYKTLIGTYKNASTGHVSLADTVRCKYGMSCLGTGFIIKWSRDKFGNVKHVVPRATNVPNEDE
jgi:hypothetical protein